jgi:hypothetical protein
MNAIARCLLALVIVIGATAHRGDAQMLALPEPVGMNGDPAARSVLAGNSAFESGDLTAAAGDYAAALRRKPDFAVATFNLGLVEIHQGKRAAGLAHMERGIGLATRNGMSPAYVRRLRALRDAFTTQST